MSENIRKKVKNKQIVSVFNMNCLGHYIVIQETDRERQTKCDIIITRAVFKSHLKNLTCQKTDT